MNSLKIRKMTYAAILLALAVLMPRVAGLIPDIGKTLNLMHIPVLLCSSAFNGMPGIFPDAVVMAFELAAYGAVAGLMYMVLPRKLGAGRIYISLLTAMLAGRIVYAAVYLFLTGTGLVKINDALLAFVWARAFVKPVLGIILQIILVPLLVMAVERAGLNLNKGRKNA